jgi:hypothetical protein
VKIKFDGKTAKANITMCAAFAAVLPRMEGRRRWTADGWFAFEASEHNVALIKEAFPDINIERKPEEEPEPIPRPGRYTYKTRPLWYQKEALKRCLHARVFALFMVQGSGKSKVAIDKVGYNWYKGKINACVVLTKKGVHRQWAENQFPQHLGGDIPTAIYCWGNHNKWQKAIFDEDRLCILCMNWDAIKTDSGMELLNQFLDFHGYYRTIIIGDESQHIMNVSSQRWKAADHIGKKAHQKIILTGTPIGKSLENEWAQFKWLDPSIIGINYISSFRSEYCIMGGFEMRQVISHRNVDKFREKVDPFAFYLGKDDLGLPPIFQEEFTFHLSKLQKQKIKDFKEELISMINNQEIEAVNPMVAVNKLQQISSGFVYDNDGKIQELFSNPKKNPRLEACLDVINASNMKKFVIWCKFKYDVQLLKRVLGDAAVTYYSGNSPQQNEESKKVFLDMGNNITYFIATPASAGTGQNLQGPDRHVIYYSHTDNAIDFWQSRDRTHRIGVDYSVPYTYIIGIGSEDRNVMRRTLKKESIHNMATQDLKEWLKESDETPLTDLFEVGQPSEDDEMRNALNYGDL